jgi:ribonuclease J
MKLTIHRGANEIGGSCVEMAADDNTRILVDIGRPLSGIDPVLPSNFSSVNAILISHPHEDHFGLIDKVPSNIPVYMSELSLKLINASRLFRGIPPLTNNFKFFKPWNEFKIGAFTIYPYLNDHSSAESFSFLIDTDGKRVFYTGDFRAHGRKEVLFDRLKSNPPGNVDAMLMEGTMLGRDESSACRNEDEVEERMLATMKKEEGLCFLLCSSQNLDRIVSAFRAAKQANRLFVLDIYTAYILRLFADSIKSGNTPDLSWKECRVIGKGLVAGRHYHEVVKPNPDIFKDFTRAIYEEGNLVLETTIASDPSKYIIRTSLVESFIRKYKIRHSSIIYSMWEGYLDEKHNPKGWKGYERLMKMPAVNFTRIHTSGHAYLKDLKDLSNAINPKMLIPIHTGHADDYIEHFSNVLVLPDGEKIMMT